MTREQIKLNAAKMSDALMKTAAAALKASEAFRRTRAYFDKALEEMQSRELYAHVAAKGKSKACKDLADVLERARELSSQTTLSPEEALGVAREGLDAAWVRRIQEQGHCPVQAAGALSTLAMNPARIAFMSRAAGVEGRIVEADGLAHFACPELLHEKKPYKAPSVRLALLIIPHLRIGLMLFRILDQSFEK
jgi:hypothetical protein